MFCRTSVVWQFPPSYSSSPTGRILVIKSRQKPHAGNSPLEGDACLGPRWICFNMFEDSGPYSIHWFVPYSSDKSGIEMGAYPMFILRPGWWRLLKTLSDSLGQQKRCPSRCQITMGPLSIPSLVMEKSPRWHCFKKNVATWVFPSAGAPTREWGYDSLAWFHEFKVKQFDWNLEQRPLDPCRC